MSDRDEPATARVLLLNDDETTMEFVVHVLENVFGKTREEALKLVPTSLRHASYALGGGPDTRRAATLAYTDFLLNRPGPALDVYLKLEVLQPVGSFKIRGAFNVVSQIPPEHLRDGVWTVSAGNAVSVN